MKIYFSRVDFFSRLKIKKAFQNAQNVLSIPNCCELGVSFVCQEQMRFLNNQQRQIDKVTDVLSFPNIENTNREQIDLQNFASDINPDTGNLMLGDIVVCKGVAKRQAKQIGHSTVCEVVFLCVHGLLHLLGYDHMTENDEEQMTALQRKILNL